MILRTKAMAIKDVAERWSYTYSSVGWPMVHGFSQSYDVSSRDIYESLLALPANATEEDVAKVIGNGSWIRLICGECNEDSERVVIAGSEDSVYLCPECLDKATALIEQVQ